MASRIAKLAAQIASNTQKVDNFLNTNKLPQPSFDEDGPVELGLSTDIETARLAVLNDTLELQALLQGPVQLLRPIVRSAPLPSLSFPYIFLTGSYIDLTPAIAERD